MNLIIVSLILAIIIITGVFVIYVQMRRKLNNELLENVNENYKKSLRKIFSDTFDYFVEKIREEGEKNKTSKELIDFGINLEKIYHKSHDDSEKLLKQIINLCQTENFTITKKIIEFKNIFDSYAYISPAGKDITNILYYERDAKETIKRLEKSVAKLLEIGENKEESE